MTSCHLGVDAGNSKTLAVVASSDGRVLGRGRSGTGDLYAVGGPGGALVSVRAAVEQALADAGVGMRALGGAAFRLAGVDWPEDGAHWRGAIAAAWPDLAAFSVKNDGFGLLRLGDPHGGTGVSVVLGTGGAMAARGPGGAEASLSFWSQDPLGALGLGAAAFRAIVRAELGMDPPTALGGLVASHFGCADVTALLHRFTRRVGALPEERKAETSRLVLRAAAEGDIVADRIVRDQAGAAAAYAAALARRVGLDAGSAFAVPLGGSLVAAGERLLADSLIGSLTAVFPRAVVQPVTGSPVIGAALDAMAEAGVHPGPGAVRSLTSAAHPPAFLLT